MCCLVYKVMRSGCKGYAALPVFGFNLAAIPSTQKPRQ